MDLKIFLIVAHPAAPLPVLGRWRSLRSGSACRRIIRDARRPPSLQHDVWRAHRVKGRPPAYAVPVACPQERTITATRGHSRGRRHLVAGQRPASDQRSPAVTSQADSTTAISLAVDDGVLTHRLGLAGPGFRLDLCSYCRGMRVELGGKVWEPVPGASMTARSSSRRGHRGSHRGERLLLVPY